MDSKFGGGGGKGGGGETDKLNIDSIIARLLEGWINRLVSIKKMQGCKNFCL